MKNLVRTLTTLENLLDQTFLFTGRGKHCFVTNDLKNHIYYLRNCTYQQRDHCKMADKLT